MIELTLAGRSWCWDPWSEGTAGTGLGQEEPEEAAKYSREEEREKMDWLGSTRSPCPAEFPAASNSQGLLLHCQIHGIIQEPPELCPVNS